MTTERKNGEVRKGERGEKGEKDDLRQKLVEIKANCTLDQLCVGLPSQFKMYSLPKPLQSTSSSSYHRIRDLIIDHWKLVAQHI